MKRRARLEELSLCRGPVQGRGRGFLGSGRVDRGVGMVAALWAALFVVGCGEKTGAPKEPHGGTSRAKREGQQGDDAPRETGAQKAKGRQGETRGAPRKTAPRPLQRSVKAQVKPYKVKPGLANVVNRSVFKKALTSKMKSKLVKNGFVAKMTKYVQMFFIYEENEYKRPRYPAFITTDVMLHTYHMFFSYALRTLESRRLYGAAEKMCKMMIQHSRKQLEAARSKRVKEAARKNLGFFSVARALLSKKALKVDPKVKRWVEAELRLIKKHAGRTPSPLLGVKLDYSMFKVRGHYTRSDRLKRYFRALMWFGLAPFPLPNKGKVNTPTVQALLMTHGLHKMKRGKTTAADLWRRIYEPTVFFVGVADDYSVDDYEKVIKEVFGESPKLDDFASKAKVNRFTAAVGKLPGPRIKQFYADGKTPTGRQFRFMGQRFIPDSRILQELTHPKVERRFFPSGLDVFAALGSKRAEVHLKKHHRVGKHRGYKQQLAKMRAEMGKVSLDTWRSNLYWGWLWMLDAIIEEVGAGYPSFMRSSAWKDKSLLTALGSWTELRHDTLLYAKPSAAECGGGEQEEYKRPKGYVEPNLVFWQRLKWLTDATRKGLERHKVLDRKLKSKLKWLSEWTEFCLRITIKELTNKRVTDAEYEKMRYLGAELEAMFQQFSGGQFMTEIEKDMAVVADVHTSSGRVLEEAVGRAAAIYVVVPVDGKLQLTRGAIFTHYEFLQPASNRLNDEQWKKRLKKGKVPSMASWLKSFFVGSVTSKSGVNNFMGGC